MKNNLNEIKNVHQVHHKNYDGGNWNVPDDSYTQTLLEQNQRNFWLPEEISLAADLNVWSVIPDNVKLAYGQNLAVLTFLDTYQGDLGMNIVCRSLEQKHHQRKALLSFMQAVENSIHAKSYSNIFMTYLPSQEINDLFTWAENSDSMQNILAQIVGYYKNLEKLVYEKEHTNKIVDEVEYKKAQWKAMCASTFLESALFYTGFYYPLWFAGQGKLTGAGEIISLIVRDEAVHGLYVGMLAQEIFNEMSEEDQNEMKDWIYKLVDELYSYEQDLIHEIYDPVGLSHDVKIFLRYNFNKALMNLGHETYFPNEDVNPVVLRGLDVGSKQHDFFSQKGDTYTIRKIEQLNLEDIQFSEPRIALGE